MAIRNPHVIPTENDGIDFDDSPLMLGGERSDDPAPYNNRVQLYAKRDSGGYLDTYILDERNHAVRLTSRGRVPAADTINVKALGAVGDGITDDSAAFNAAFALTDEGGGEIYVPPGTYLVTETLYLGAGCTIRGTNPFTTIIKKGFNGDLIYMGGAVVMSDLQLHGDSTTYSGRLVFVGNGIAQAITNCWFTNFAGGAGGYAIEFDFNQGSQSFVTGCAFNPTTTFTVAIKIPDGPETGIPRTITNCEGGGSILVDFAGGSDIIVADCFTNGFVFSANSNLCFISNCRVATVGATTTISGGAVTIVNCHFAGPIIFDASSVRCFFTNSSAPFWEITDLGVGNRIDHGPRSFVTTWTGTVVNPALGDGTFTGEYRRDGDVIEATFELTIGSTTTFGTGAWIFTLPRDVVNSNPLRTGFGFVIAAATAQVAVPYALPGTSTCKLLAGTNASGLLEAGAASHVWAPGDILRFTTQFRTS